MGKLLEARAKAGTTAAIGALIRLQSFQMRGPYDPQLALLHVLCCIDDGDLLEDCARVFEYGMRKYAAWNWARGQAWSIPIGSAMRHLVAMARGEENDPESGLPHRGHAACNLVMLAWYAQHYQAGDDRPPRHA